MKIFGKLVGIYKRITNLYYQTIQIMQFSHHPYLNETATLQASNAIIKKYRVINLKKHTRVHS